jgi:hypothetical protein
VSFTVAKLSAAPLLIATAPWIEEAIPERVPLVTFVLDMVFVPVKFNVPTLISVPGPDIAPEKLPPPTVKRFAPKIAMDPAPLIEPMVLFSAVLSVPATA